MFRDTIKGWLENALDAGIKEQEFWFMTCGEVARAIESYNRRYKAESREKACFDYVLADLIGRSIARIHSSSATMPELYECYPSLFDNEEIQEQKAKKQAELSAIRFKLFTNSFNKRFEEAKKNE